MQVLGYRIDTKGFWNTVWIVNPFIYLFTDCKANMQVIVIQLQIKQTGYNNLAIAFIKQVYPGPGPSLY